MDTGCFEMFRHRMLRIVTQLHSNTNQSLHEIRHDLECIASAATCLLSRSTEGSLEYDVLTNFVGYVVEAIECLEHSAIQERTGSDPLGTCQMTSGGRVGRPAFIIAFEQLEYLAEQNFTAAQIAEIIGTSKRTIERRLKAYNISLNQRYSVISDQDLDSHVSSITNNFPDIGYRSVRAHLSSSGHNIQEIRVRESMRRVDLEGVLCRRMTLKPTLRRSYHVPGSNSLWHIDGYHKLIRWRLVIHGGIDGYSRVPVFLKISNNNRAATVLECFREAVTEFGTPERVRSDKGGENVAVAEMMIRNKGAGSHITGRSVHNQRIERFWRDLWTGCIMLFYNLFYHMESVGLLNRDSDVHLQCLHYIFIPRIQDHLKRFQSAYIRKPLRTERNRTPIQLFIQGQMNSSTLLHDDGDFGIETGEYVLPDEIARIDIPDTPDDLHHRLSCIDPMSTSNSFGMDLYEAVLNLAC